MKRRPGQVAGAFVVGAALGAAGGAALGGGLPIGALWGAVIGALLVGGGEAVTDAVRTRGSMKPLWWRITTSTTLAAVFGWLVELVLPDWNLGVYGAFFGFVFGALGVRLRKIALGIAIGTAVGLGLEWLRPESNLPLVAACTMAAYRSASAALFRGMDQTSVMGEQVQAADVDYVVPFAARTRYVGVDFLKDYADLTGADFVRNPADIGIVSAFGDLRGPSFDPDRVHPLIWEFYEHTSRFHLTIVPDWRWWMKPAYLAYRTFVAKPLGQANAPFGVEEVQRGVVSWIDAIDIDHSGEVDFRAWVRSYESTGEPLYLGIYTVLQRHDGSYVSVGFPLPSANFTATLLPVHNRGDGLLLKSKTELASPGHYLSTVDADNDQLSVIKLHSFDEEIDVYVQDGELKTDHRFYLSGILFLTLYHEIERKSWPPIEGAERRRANSVGHMTDGDDPNETTEDGGTNPSEYGDFPLKQFLGMEVIDDGPGVGRARVDVGPDHLNPNGVVHGAVLFALADTAMGKSTMSVIEPGRFCASIEVSLRFIRPAMSGELTAVATVLKRGRHVVHLEARITGDEQSLIATAAGTFAIIES